MISTIIFSALIVLGSAHCPAFTTLRAAGGGFGASYFKYCLQSKFLGNPRVFYRPIPDQQALRALNQKVSFSASYIPTRPSAVLNIPLLGGAVAIAHSNPRCRCNLTKEQLCGIFMGKITEWDEIGCNCEDNKITVIVRQDDSGDIDIVTGSLLAYCGIDVDENAPVWPPGVITVNGNEGVIDALNENPCAIAYIGYGAVEQADLKTCAIQNRSGKFVGPNKRSVEMGIAGASLDKNRIATSAGSKSKGAYPILCFFYGLFGFLRDIDQSEQWHCLNYICKVLLSDRCQRRIWDFGGIPLSEINLRKARMACELLMGGRP